MATNSEEQTDSRRVEWITEAINYGYGGGDAESVRLQRGMVDMIGMVVRVVVVVVMVRAVAVEWCSSEWEIG